MGRFIRGTKFADPALYRRLSHIGRVPGLQHETNVVGCRSANNPQTHARLLRDILQVLQINLHRYLQIHRGQSDFELGRNFPGAALATRTGQLQNLA